MSLAESQRSRLRWFRVGKTHVPKGARARTRGLVRKAPRRRCPSVSGVDARARRRVCSSHFVGSEVDPVPVGCVHAGSRMGCPLAVGLVGEVLRSAPAGPEHSWGGGEASGLPCAPACARARAQLVETRAGAGWGAGQGRGRQSYTRVVECPCGKLVLFCPPLKVLKVCRGCMPVSVLGIMVMVLGVMSGMSSGERRRVSV